MAKRDEPRLRRRPRFERYQYEEPVCAKSYQYDDERNQVTIEYYKSDDEPMRFARRGAFPSHRHRAPSPPPVQSERTPNKSHYLRVPSPPSINRNRSIGRDGRDQKWKAAQTLGYVPQNNRDLPLPDSAGSSVPTISFHVDPRPHESRARRSAHDWARTQAAGLHGETSDAPQIASPASSGVLGERAYQYEALGTLEFRLVCIMPKAMSTVKCRMVRASLTDPPPYIAISYAWGDADVKRSIQIDSVTIPVAIRLYGALDAIRKRGEEVLVWVDALSIDQQNHEERNQQVRLMTRIYAEATEMAIWLGPFENDSHIARRLLEDIAITDDEDIPTLLSSPDRRRGIDAVACLFQRDYWQRLWVVQEVFNAKAKRVYCGDSSGLPWGVYQRAADIFRRYKRELDLYDSANSVSRRKHVSGTSMSLSLSQALVYEGPNSLLDADTLDGLEEESLLTVLRACRRKLTSEPRDKIFGILGVLPEVVRKEFPVDYNLSIKAIYTNVVDFLLYTTERLDVICESIHFPKQTSIASLPSWVPDWSQIPDSKSLGFSYSFTASGDTDAVYQFLDEHRNELEISAIYIDTVSNPGVAVGTLCLLSDYLMAFLQWRAMLLSAMSRKKLDVQLDAEEAFCRTISLGQVPRKGLTEPSHSPNGQGPRRYQAYEWVEVCYHVFATHILNRIPYLPLDETLRHSADSQVDVGPNPRQFLQSHFGSHMMGRRFFLTEHNLCGMGTGCLLPDDVIILPLGCRTPILIRREGKARYRFVGDVYLDGYMDGKGTKQMEAGERQLEKFVLV